MLQFPDKIRKTGRKRDAILTHHFRQRAGLLCCRAGPGSAGAALPWLARTILFLAASDPAPSRKPASMSSPPICAGSAGPARRRTSAPTPSSTMSATWSRWWRRLAKSRPSLSAMTGVRRSPGTRRCSGPMSSPRSRASAFRRPPADAACRSKPCGTTASPISTGSIFSRRASPKPSSSAMSPRPCESCWADAGSPIRRPINMFRRARDSSPAPIRIGRCRTG